MVSSSKSTTFVFFLVFISTSLNTSLAYTNNPVTRKVLVEDENGFTMTSDSSLRHMEHKEILNGGDEVAKRRMEGRKMMVERKDMKKEGDDDESDSLTTSSSNGNSSPEYSVGNYSHKGHGKMMKVQRKLRIRSTPNSNKDNTRGFMAFNADYHVARPHPPKNN